MGDEGLGLEVDEGKERKRLKELKGGENECEAGRGWGGGEVG